MSLSKNETFFDRLTPRVFAGRMSCFQVSLKALVLRPMIWYAATNI